VYLDKINKTEWKIYINGDKNYIEDLILIFKNLNFGNIIYKEDENYLLDSKIFNKIDNAYELSQKIKTFLTLLSTTPPFRKLEDFKPLKVIKIIEILENGKIEKIYNSEGEIIIEIQYEKDGKKTISKHKQQTKEHLELHTYSSLITENGRIIFGIYTIEGVKSQIISLKEDSEKFNKLKEYLKPYFEVISKYSNNYSQNKVIREIINIFNNPDTYESKSETLRWVSLYKIYELIEKDFGDYVNFMKENKILKLANKEDIESFKSTANYYYRHSIFRIFYQKPKKKKMSLSEAEEFISILLLKYVSNKVQNLSIKN